MRDLVRRRSARSCLATLFIAACAITGCGEGERMQTGSQVEVSDDLLKEAHAQDAYFDQQKKAGKQQPAVVRDSPGAAPPSN